MKKSNLGILKIAALNKNSIHIAYCVNTGSSLIFTESSSPAKHDSTQCGTPQSYPIIVRNTDKIQTQ